jgi:hypothetical protein
MPQHQRHRGKHPQDDKLFSHARIDTLRRAVSNLSYLFSQGYAETAALKLVGDHYQLTTRQRRAVLGASCADAALESRRARFLPPERVRGSELVIDGYNQLITVESILAGGILLRGRDGCIRDLASVHGSYRRVDETLEAIHLLGQTLHELGAARVTWLFDAPVSNSGRLRALMLDTAEQHGWPWDVQLISNVDKTLAQSTAIVVTSDSWILDRAQHWTRITDLLLRHAGPEQCVISLASPPKDISAG